MHRLLHLIMSHIKVFSLFFLFALLIGIIPLSCLPVHWSFCNLHLLYFWTTLFKFLVFSLSFGSDIVFFGSVIFVWYFKKYFLSLLEFLLCSCIILLTSVNFFMIIILNYLLGKSLISVLLKSASGFLPSFGRYSSVSSFSLTFSVGFCSLDKISHSWQTGLMQEINFTNYPSP